MMRVMSVAVVLAVGWAGVSLQGCSKREVDAPAESAAEAAADTKRDKPREEETTPAAAVPPEPADAADVHLDLMRLAHMADVDHHGLFIDFGTPARMKYTVGHWKTGWGSDQVDGDTSFTNVGSTAGRVYFPVERVEAVTLRMRVKPIGSRNLSLFVNNKALPVVVLDKANQFADYDVPVPAEHLVAGENYLLLRLGGSEKVNGEDVSIAVDSVRVIPGTPKAEPYVAPRYSQLAREVQVDGQRRQALVTAAPTRLSWYVDVPKDATLRFQLGLTGEKAVPATARIRVTPEGGKTAEILAQNVETRWRAGSVSLAAYAGQIVRLDLIADGDAGATVAWARPVVALPTEKPSAPAKVAKNIVVLTIDTLRADKLKPYNPKSRVQTPAIDAMAAEGVVFTSAQSPENWTKPSVASILTGLYPATHGTKLSESKLPEDALLVSEVLKGAGFATGTFLANGYVSDKFGFHQGWDHYTNYIRERKSTEAENVFREAAKWVEAHKDERFFAYIQTIDPHVPYDPPEDTLKLYDAQPYNGQVKNRMTADLLEKAKRNPPKVVFTERDKRRLEALYDGEITYHDRHMAEFVERLKALGLYDDTIFVLTSDHGEELDDHGSWGHGHSVYQELLGVPFIVRLPGVAPAGARVTESVGTLDIAPTVLEAAGVAVPDVMEGRSRVGHMRGIRPPGPAVAFSDFLDDRRTIRAGRWKLILRGLNTTLFDLEKDPREQRELDHSRHPIAMRYCRVMLGQFLGAQDRRNWLEAQQKARGGLRTEGATIDEELRGQLEALGYVH